MENRTIRANGHVVGAGANLYAADLSFCDLRFLDLRGADLRRSNLRGTDFTGTDLRGVDFFGASLTGADFSFARVVLPESWYLDERGCAFVKRLPDGSCMSTWAPVRAPRREWARPAASKVRQKDLMRLYMWPWLEGKTPTLGSAFDQVGDVDYREEYNEDDY